MTYKEALATLETFTNYEKKISYTANVAFKLERMQSFLSFLGDPQKDLKVIHVAGTKGKGSTSCFIASILKEEGFGVGLYTSPHLKDYRERIRLLDSTNGTDEKISFPGMILKNDFARLLKELEPSIVSFHQSAPSLGELTFFEILTTMALKYFNEKKADFVVLETGLGGRLDATNACDSLVSIITSLSYDHESILGHTLPEIAFEKAGIIKSSNIKTKDGIALAVTAAQDKEAMKILRRRAKAQGSVLFEMNKDFTLKKLSSDLVSQDFFYKGLNNEPLFLNIRLLGDHQLINASVALAACEALALHGIRVTAGALRRGLSKAHWPGRLEVVHTKPFVILDGAHNRHSADRLVDFLDKEFKSFRKWLVFGASEDKDLKGMIERLEPLADRVILTRADNPRAADPEKFLKPYFKKGIQAITASVEEALKILKKEIAPDEVAVITGSLFVVGEARSLWQE
jgi:dihydrofolate synthase/folylpolyglutamate synthase